MAAVVEGKGGGDSVAAAQGNGIRVLGKQGGVSLYPLMAFTILPLIWRKVCRQLWTELSFYF